MSRYEAFAATALELAAAIQAIPAPTFNEGQRADFFQNQFHALGLHDVQRDSVGNVLGRLPGADKPHSDARPLVVSAHTDTVHPLGTPLNTRIFEDRIVGPGIGDNALGLAALLSLIPMLKDKQARLPGDLWLAANVGEEGLGNLRGMQAVVDRFGAEPLAYLVLEGMGLGTVLHRGLGVERFRISIETPGGHSWVNYGQPSAIHELCSLVTRLASIPLPERPCTSMNAGVIQGGTSINTIAAHAWLELDLRSEDKATLAHLVKQVKHMSQAVERPNVHVQIEHIGQRQAGELPENHPLIGLARGVLNDLGIFSRLDINSTDANLPLSRGYPAICVGITHGNNAHSVDEFILTQPVARGLEQLYLLVTRAWDRLTSQ